MRTPDPNLGKFNGLHQRYRQLPTGSRGETGRPQEFGKVDRGFPISGTDEFRPWANRSILFQRIGLRRTRLQSAPRHLLSPRMTHRRRGFGYTRPILWLFEKYHSAESAEAIMISASRKLDSSSSAFIFFRSILCKTAPINAVMNSIR